MTRTLGPRAGIGQDMAVPASIIVLLGLPVALTAWVWVAGRAASWIAGHGFVGPHLSTEFAGDFVTRGPSAYWPSVPPSLVWGVTIAGLVLVVALTVAVWLKVTGGSPGGDPLQSLAAASAIASLAPKGATARARQLRPSLAGVKAKNLNLDDIGVTLGRLLPNGPVLRATWEDVLLAVMAPRAGKTTALAVPAILGAPGAVIATSNKSDLWAATAALRADTTGETVWTFDPQHVVHGAQTWWWNPLGAVDNVEEAYRLAGHFVQEIRGERLDRDFWSQAAHDLLTSLLLAAATSGRTLSSVFEWLSDPIISIPVELLREHGHTAAASSLLGRQNGAPETRDGVYETARTAAQCMRDPQIMAWVTPPPSGRDMAQLDPATLVVSRQTLFLLSKEGAGAAAPLVAALTDRVMREATRAAEHRGGRLDPPVVVVLDEAANVCRIADLPDLYSHLGARGVLPVTILQSYRQGVRVWGEAGMDAMWSASTVKVIGPGIDDAKLADDLSRLIGDHDVTVRSVSYGRGGHTESSALRRQRILAPEDIRALPRGKALVLATGSKAAMVQLLPWYNGPHRATVQRAAANAIAELTTRARLGQEVTR
jgi:type IV secretory pathway TraG/TraD family ATPase VirD4